MTRRSLQTSLLTLAATLAVAAPAAACDGAGLQPRKGNLSEIRSATLCLINQERSKRGLAKLHASRKLRKAAQRHSRNMAKRNFFDHTSPAGSTMVARITRAGYRSWASLGENIAWGSGNLATPRAIVRGWMRSPGHRQNMLRPGFREVGVGISFGLPVRARRGETGATYTTDFGVRR